MQVNQDEDEITVFFQQFVRKKRVIMLLFLILVPSIAVFLLYSRGTESGHFGHKSENVFSTTEMTVIDSVDGIPFPVLLVGEFQSNNISSASTTMDDDWDYFSRNNSVVNITTDVGVEAVAVVVDLNINDKYIRFLDRNIAAEDWQLLQNTRDHWSYAGKWIAGDNDIRYDMTFPVPHLVSYGCEHYELKKTSIPMYKWVVDVDNITSGHSFPPFPTQYSKHRMCAVLGGQRILLVGDSLQEHFYFYFGLIGIQNMEIVATSMMKNAAAELTINCTEHGFLPIELYFIRSDRLYIGNIFYEEATNYTNYVDHPFIHIVQEHDITLLLLNRGAHYVNNNNLVRNLDQLFQYLLKTYDDKVSIVFRNTSPGHPDCNKYSYSPPLSKPPDLQINRGNESMDSAHRYHWSEFQHQNSLIQKLIAEQYPSILLLDIATPTILRPDHHVGGDDCLHYCCHSVVDHWLLLFINVLEQVQLVGSK